MYRSRPKGELEEKVLTFLSSVETDKEILTYDLLGTEAHVLMLHKKKYLNLDELKIILSAIEEAKRTGSKVTENGFEDIHEAVEAFVIKKAGLEIGGKMHTARSRNDQIALDLRLKVRDDINSICILCLNLVHSLQKRAKENLNTVFPLYTHLQQAQFGTFSHFLISYAYSLLRDVERLCQVYERINQSPLGGCAIAGTSLNIDRMDVSKTLGFGGLVLNSIDATSSRDVFVEFVSSIAILFTTLSRLAEDLIIWSTSEFGYIELADQYSSTSSAMPQKKNPDPLEIIRGKAATSIGELVSVLCTLKSLPSGYNRDLQELKPSLFRSAAAANLTLTVMIGLIATLAVNKPKMNDASEKSYAIAIDIAEGLVEKYRLPFRVAHKIVGSLVTRAISKDNTPLNGLTLKDVEETLSSSKTGASFDLSAHDLLQAVRDVSVISSIEARKSAGSPRKTEQKLMLDEISSMESKFKLLVDKRESEVRASIEHLEQKIKEIIKK